MREKNNLKNKKNYLGKNLSPDKEHFELIQISTFMRNRLLITNHNFQFKQGIVLLQTILFVFIGMQLNSQCVNDGTSPTFFGCSDKVIQLNPGQCSVFMQPNVYATDNCNGAEFIQTHNSDASMDGRFGCDSGETHYYQVFSLASSTPVRIAEVEFGHLNVTGTYDVDVNVYITDGTNNTDNWTQIGSGTANNVTGTGYSSAFTTTSLVNTNQWFAVEVITPSSITGDSIMAFNTMAQAFPTFVTAPACGIDVLMDLGTLTSPNAGALINVRTVAESVDIIPTNMTVKMPNDEFEEGIYNLSYQAVDAAGNSSNCAFTLEVVAVANPVTSISCNDLVNISLDEECMATVSPDDVLEGGPYSCYDNYTVTIFDETNKPFGDVVDASHIGLRLRVEVEDENSNKCWGEIMVEDKHPPVMDCFPVYTSCSSDLTPGELMSRNITYDAEITSAKIGGFDPSSNVYEVDVFGVPNATLEDIAVIIDVSHNDVSQLSATLEAPNGDLITLFSGLSCTNQDMYLTLDDYAANSYVDLVNECGATSPAVMGHFRPEEALASLVSPSDWHGTWKITINDHVDGDGGEVNKLSIVFKQSGAIMPFPSHDITHYSNTGTSTYLVEGLDACGPATMSYTDEVVEMDCDSRYSKIIDRTWNAVDAYGNTAIPCIQRIYVYRNGLGTLMFPPDYDGVEEPSFSCSEYGMQVPPPTDAGAGYPYGDFCDNIQIFEPEDTRIDICTKSYKILRNWKVVEWCSGQVIEHTQIIKVEDKTSPRIICPEDVTISTDPLECTRDYTTPDPEIYDFGCTDPDDVVVARSYYYSVDGTVPPDAIFTYITGKTINDLPQGLTFVKYEATDDCGNTSECIQLVTVVDEVPPVAVCDQFTNVSLGSDGYAWVDAITFDDLSHDNCELVDYKVRKMTNECDGHGSQTTFRDKILFCCEEMGTSIMVALQVTDKSGNQNTCMVEAKIEDKLPPYVECPDNITIDCYEDYNDLDLTGEAKGFDNCAVVSLEHKDTGDLNNCGEGTIRRTWTVKDKNYANSCVQRIELIDSDPFDYNDITWPRDYTAKQCEFELHPDNLSLLFSYPRFRDKNCSLLSYEYKDQVFTFVDGACEKILRTWTVIDWCTYDVNDPNNPYDDEGIYTDLQILKLTNEEAPQFVSCDDRMAEVYGDCEGNVIQGIAAEDDCTPDSLLKYDYVIDVYNDEKGPHLTGVTDTFNRILPIGKHKVTWTVEDQCGNIETCSYILMVVDGKKPTPYCLTTVTTVVMPSSGSIELWASDFDYGSFDNCTAQEDLVFTFSTDIKDSNKTFTCADIPDGIEMYVPITMYVHDAAGNYDFCSVGLILQDGIGNVCDDVTRHGIAGRVTNEANDAIENVQVMAITQGAEVMVSSQMTAQNGDFSVLVGEGTNINIQNDKEDDIMNGISTLDLVLMQRHILEINEFNSPYKVIAADVNNDSKVSASDLVALRKVILGLEMEFPNGQKEWRFVDKAQVFTDYNQPFPFNEKIDFSNVESAQYDVDFIGMKIGDVNISALTNLRDTETDNRSTERLDLTYTVAQEGDYAYIDVYSVDGEMILGLQTELKTSLNSEIIGIESGAIDFKPSDFYINNNSVRMSFASMSEVTLDSNQPLFSMIVKKNGDLSNLKMANTRFENEAYSTSMEVMDVTLAPRTSNDNGIFELLQNKPNPFAESSMIEFSIPDDGDVTLEVYDVTGKLLHNETKACAKGQNQFVVNSEDLKYAGIMYYQITFGENKAIKKMVRVK